RRFSAATLAGQPQDFPPPERKADIVDRVYLAVRAVVDHADVLDIQQCPLFAAHSFFHQATTSFVFLNILMTFFAGLSTRRRGLAISSMPKLIKVRLPQKTAMHRPAGTKSHHWPAGSAESFCA